MGSNTSNATRTKSKSRRYSPKPLVLPAEDVSWRPSGDWPDDIREYLIAYARTGSRAGACRLIGRSTDWAYRREQEYGDALTEEENSAYMSIIDRLEQTLAHRAANEPGMPGVTSAIFLLKGAKPEKYAERQELKHSGHVAVDWVSMMRDGIEEQSNTDNGNSR